MIKTNNYYKIYYIHILRDTELVDIITFILHVIKPLGVAELRDLGIIPGLEVYDKAEALYISHTYMDHIGLLSAVPPDIEVVLPDIRVAEETLFSWYKGSRTWLAYLPPSYRTRIVNAKNLSEDSRGVVAIPVSHSAYLANSFLYLGKNLTLFYSGDLRLEPLVAIGLQDLREVLRKLGVDSVDVAIVEGTNFSLELEHFPVTPQLFRESLTYTLSVYDLVTVSIDPLDLEALLFILSSASMFGRQVVLASNRLLWAIDYLRESLSHTLQNVYIALEVGVAPRTQINTVELGKVLSQKKDFVLVVEPISFLEILRRLRLWVKELEFTNSVVILMDPEPREAVKEVEENTIARWLRAFGFEVYRLRVSGHYLPHQLVDLVEILKPEVFIPLHTENPLPMTAIYKKTMGRCNPQHL